MIPFSNLTRQMSKKGTQISTRHCPRASEHNAGLSNSKTEWESFLAWQHRLNNSGINKVSFPFPFPSPLVAFFQFSSTRHYGEHSCSPVPYLWILRTEHDKLIRATYEWLIKLNISSPLSTATLNVGQKSNAKSLNHYCWIFRS